jgi:hypothetical protein
MPDIQNLLDDAKAALNHATRRDSTMATIGDMIIVMLDVIEAIEVLNAAMRKTIDATTALARGIDEIEQIEGPYDPVDFSYVV